MNDETNLKGEGRISAAREIMLYDGTIRIPRLTRCHCHAPLPGHYPFCGLILYTKPFPRANILPGFESVSIADPPAELVRLADRPGFFSYDGIKIFRIPTTSTPFLGGTLSGGMR